MGVAFQNRPADGGGLHGGEQGAQRSEDFRRGGALVADEPANPDVAVFHDDAFMEGQGVETIPHGLFFHPGFKGDLAAQRPGRERKNVADMGNLVDFLIRPSAERKKGRELRTVNERRAYSPEGYCISPLPA